MGMFDYVSGIDIDCPKCGKKLFDWQSKDRECLMDEIPFSEVSNFYTSCTECGLWFEFYLKPQKRTLDDYKIVIRELGGSKRFPKLEKKVSPAKLKK